MKERPIIFSAPMVRAILAGTKSQTRRIVKPEPHAGVRVSPFVQSGLEDGHGRELRFSFGQPGDRLWVREAWASDGSGGVRYYATDDVHELRRKRSPIHMPRWASRITLEITGVRVERVQEISRGDAMAEGCPFQNMAQGDDPRQWYADLWRQINGADSWDANPWVWCISFKRIAS